MSDFKCIAIIEHACKRIWFQEHIATYCHIWHSNCNLSIVHLITRCCDNLKILSLQCWWGFCNSLTSKLITFLIDGFTSRMKAHLLTYLLGGSAHIYWIWDPWRYTQYGVCSQVTFKNARAMFFSFSDGVGSCFRAGLKKSRQGQKFRQRAAPPEYGIPISSWGGI